MIEIDFKNSGISREKIKRLFPALRKETEALIKASDDGYDDLRASINLPADKKMLRYVKSMISKAKKMKPEYLVVLGIGGSILGTQAVQEAITGRMHNMTTKGIKVLYADTTDSATVSDIISIITPVLKKKKKVIINAISKSGGTTEPMANFQAVLDVVKRYDKKYEESVFITSGQGSKFWQVAEQEGFSLMSIPAKVGGRYSVLSPVGIFPLGLLGVDITRLVEGAADMKEKCLARSVPKNPAAIGASAIYLNNKAGRNIYDLFLFGNNLESIGKWYRQLMGESIGKEKDIKGNIINCGITPTVSIGSVDLHSLAQLNWGGPDDKFTCFVREKKPSSDIKVPKNCGFSILVDNIQGKSLSDIMDAIYKGTIITYRKLKRNYSEISLDTVDEYDVGGFLQYKMIEMMYLAALFKVNAFDQPNVEYYKTETKRILKR